jgi:hypothetical protein
MVQKLDFSSLPRRKTLGVIACRDASRLGSIFISGRFGFRLDEPSATPNHRILGRRKSRAARANRQPTFALHRQSALPPRCASQKARQKGSGPGRDNRHTANLTGLAPKIDRQEVRWQCQQSSRTATNLKRDLGSGYPYGRGESRVGLTADSRRIIEPWTHSGPHHHY